MSLTAEQVDQAWTVIGATTHGRNARTKLLAVLTGLAPNPNDASALSQYEGKRILARELLQLMDASLNSGRDDPSSADDYPRPKREPVAYGGKRSLRRVSLTDADRADPSRRSGE